jgi:hypothetical protein
VVAAGGDDPPPRQVKRQRRRRLRSMWWYGRVRARKLAMRKVFISHAAADKELATAFEELLENGIGLQHHEVFFPGRQ